MVSVDVLNGINDCHQYLEEVLRVLRKGGILYLSFPTVIRKLFNRKLGYSYGLGFYSYKRLVKELNNLSSKYGRFEMSRAVQSTSTKFRKNIKNILRVIGLPHYMFLPQIVIILEKK